jgi:hypothetical protein
LDEIARGKFDLDVAGHYNRTDVFGFEVKPAVDERTRGGISGA